MRRINLGSFQWRVEVMSRESLTDWPEESKLSETLSKKNLVKDSVWMRSMDISILVPQILVLE